MCTKESWVTRRLNGKGAPWNKGLRLPDAERVWGITVQCQMCSVEFKVKKYRALTARFCSHPCSARFRDEGKRTRDKKVRQSAAYRAWRRTIFERDGYSCRNCGKHGGYLNADHIKPFALYPSLRFDTDNGRTLCVPCHRATGTFGRGAIYRRCVAYA